MNEESKIEKSKIEKSSEVNERMLSLEKTIDGINSSISNLETRLNNVLTPQIPTESELKKETKIYCPLAERLEKAINKLIANNNRLDNIFARLEN